MPLSRDLVQTVLAAVVGGAALVVVLVATGVLAPSTAQDFGRYLQPFDGLTGTERVVVLVTAVVLLVRHQGSVRDMPYPDGQQR
jgi:hypothetical protein